MPPSKKEGREGFNTGPNYERSEWNSRGQGPSNVSAHLETAGILGERNFATDGAHVSGQSLAIPESVTFGSVISLGIYT